MPIQPPGKQPIRPAHAANAGNGGGRIPSGNGEGQISRSKAQKITKQPKPTTPVGQAAKFMFTPEIGRSFEGLKFAWDILVGLVAQIYVGVKLIPANHPAADFRNAKDYKLSDIIKIAYGSLKWEQSQIPQILIFFAVLLFLVFLVLLTVTLVMNIAVNTAHAQNANNTATPNDILTQIFNVQSGGFIPAALGAMLRAYSNIVLILAGIILLYHILHYVVESARHGQAGGKSFNHAWAPVRLVAAMGLLIPLSSGLNSGQYIIIYLAKWGSDMASGVYKQFSVTIGQNQSISQATLNSEPQKALEDVFNLYVCAYRANIKEPGSINIPTAQTKANPDDANDYTYQMNFDATQQSQGSKKGCGNVSFYNNPNPTSASQALLNDQFSYFSQYIPQISALAQDYASHFDGQSANYYQTIQSSQYKDQINALSKSYSTVLNTKYQDAVTKANTALSQQMNQSITSLGWVTAPTWIHRVGEANADMANAQVALPKSEYYGADIADSLAHNGELPKEPTDGQQAQGGGSSGWGLSSAFGKLIAGPAALLSSFITSGSNPLANMITEGYGLLTTATGIVVGVIAVNAAASASAIKVDLNEVNLWINVLIGICFSTGIMLAFILPMIPTMRFIFGVLGWIVLVFIGVMGMPLFALAHLKTGGEGWIGQLQVASTYNTILGIIIRPTLIVLGLIAGIILFNTFVKLAALIMMSGMADFNGGSLGTYANNIEGAAGVIGVIGAIAASPFALAAIIPAAAGAVIKLFLMSSFFTALANSCFKLVDIIPSQAMAWMGTGAQSSPVEDGTNETVSETKGIGNQLGQMIPNASKHYAELADKKAKERRGLTGNTLKSQSDQPVGKSGSNNNNNEGGETGGRPAATIAPGGAEKTASNNPALLPGPTDGTNNRGPGNQAINPPSQQQTSLAPPQPSVPVLTPPANRTPIAPIGSPATPADASASATRTATSSSSTMMASTFGTTQASGWTGSLSGTTTQPQFNTIASTLATGTPPQGTQPASPAEKSAQPTATPPETGRGLPPEKGEK